MVRALELSQPPCPGLKDPLQREGPWGRTTQEVGPPPETCFKSCDDATMTETVEGQKDGCL